MPYISHILPRRSCKCLYYKNVQVFQVCFLMPIDSFGWDLSTIWLKRVKNTFSPLCNKFINKCSKWVKQSVTAHWGKNDQNPLAYRWVEFTINVNWNLFHSVFTFSLIKSLRFTLMVRVMPRKGPIKYVQRLTILLHLSYLQQFKN